MMLRIFHCMWMMNAMRYDDSVMLLCSFAFIIAVFAVEICCYDRDVPSYSVNHQRFDM